MGYDYSEKDKETTVENLLSNLYKYYLRPSHQEERLRKVLKICALTFSLKEVLLKVILPGFGGRRSIPLRSNIGSLPASRSVDMYVPTLAATLSKLMASAAGGRENV